MKTHSSHKTVSYNGRLPTVKSGFAFIVVVTLMILLSLLAVALLSLSVTTLRSNDNAEAQIRARANARLALNLAIAELQKIAGDDRSITADGDIVGGEAEPNAVGVWNSWSPNYTSNPRQQAPNYDSEKENSFQRWLVSGLNSDELEDQSWPTSGQTGESFELFREDADGFSLRGGTIPVGSVESPGAYAWAISQEATKAKVNIGVNNAETPNLDPNDQLQAPYRPSLNITDLLGDATGDFNRRSQTIISPEQLKLDSEIWQGDETSIAAGAHFTTRSMGLLSNVVDGGLKTDMNLGFELSDNEFSNDNLTAEGISIQNPFKAGAEVDFEPDDKVYEGQRPLYAHLGNSGDGNFTFPMRDFAPAAVQFDFPIYAAPTFDLLRSYYRTPHHVYETNGTPTIFERPFDHVASQTRPRAGGALSPPPANYVDLGSGASTDTHTAYKPVVDRAMFIVSTVLSPNNELAYAFTPIITLWNPYNVALEIEGAVSYLWIDMPFLFSYTFSGKATVEAPVSQDMGFQFAGQGHGRSVDPYFYAAITATGEPLSSDSNNAPIRFEPGEVRIFCPADPEFSRFENSASMRDRTVFLKPVEGVDGFQTKGGLYIPKAVMSSRQKVSTEFRPFSGGEDYPFFISLEDATRAKGPNPSQANDRGVATVDVLARNFANSGTTASFTSGELTYDELQSDPYPMGVLEIYHRVARQGGANNAQTADLVYTGNPRQAFMNQWIAKGNFSTGPQYETRMRELGGSTNDLVETPDGRNAFYGPSHSASNGQTRLSFFEAPTAPLLSLGAFQHADVSATSFAPANQVGNSWASAYLDSDEVADRAGRTTPSMIDHSYLANEALFDSFFFSGAAPTLTPGSSGGGPDAWENEVANESVSIEERLREFVEAPMENPLRNSRMRLHRGGLDNEELVNLLTEPAGCALIASHLMLDGAFNVNSTSQEAWVSVLSSLKNADFDLISGSSSSQETPLSRFRIPASGANDIWQGYRTLDDDEIETIAENLVEQVRQRGPFLSLAEFVNRQIGNDELSIKGALQTAIDESSVNDAALQESFDLQNFDRSGRQNISPPDTGVGIPGYLTQADVLTSLAPTITVRSDTFTIRAYGAARDPSGTVIASTIIEAVVQRMPEFVDPSDEPHTPYDELNATNEIFGRRFQVVSFQYLPTDELTT
jgi:hypothetical protein